MKLIDGEALLSFMTSKLVSSEDRYHNGWNDAVEACIDEITDALMKAKEEAVMTPVSMDGKHLGYLTPSEMSLKAPESNFEVVKVDNTLTALKLVRDAIEDNYSDEEALIYVNGMIAALEM